MLDRVILETRRLAVRHMVQDDLNFVATMLAEPEVMRFYPSPMSRAEARSWIGRQQQRYAEDGYGLWLVLDRESGEPLGQVGLVAVELRDTREAALTYLIHRPFWGRGYASEAARASCDYAFQQLAAARVITLIRPENLPSQAVARRIGMVAEAEIDFKGYRHIVFALAAGESQHAT